MLENLADYNIILASQSPRRKELLSGLDIPFTVEVLDVDESFPEELKGEEIPIYLAELKANAFKSRMQDNSLIITADTIVWLEDKMLGKPKDLDDAKSMLRSLSGKTHEVFTGVCIMSKAKQKSFCAVSHVRFAVLSEEEIDYYLSKYKPLDKAGSYGVQEWIGYVAVEHIDGSYFNVMGLPIHRLYEELKAW